MTGMKTQEQWRALRKSASYDLPNSRSFLSRNTFILLQDRPPKERVRRRPRRRRETRGGGREGGSRSEERREKGI